MDDIAKLTAARSALPAVGAYAYFNAGTYGPMTTFCESALRDWYREELVEGRIAPGRFAQATLVKAEARRALARLVNARPEDIALTRHTTDGMNLAIFGQNWQPGDEIVTTDVEHGGGLLPVRLAERRFGVTVSVVPVSQGIGDLAVAVADQLTSRTRLVSISHVSWSTGELYDVRAVAEVCHSRGVPVVVDGAQAAGAIPVDVAELGVDYYAFPGQKWLLGPSGTGGFYVHPDRLADLQPAWLGTGAISSHDDLDDYVLWPDARRFEGATTTDLGAIAGLTASVNWLLIEVGLEWAAARARALAERAIDGLSAIRGVTIVTPPNRSNLVCFRVAGLTQSEVVDRLAKASIVARAVSATAVARLAIGFYNAEDEVDRTVSVVADLARAVT